MAGICLQPADHSHRLFTKWPSGTVGVISRSTPLGRAGRRPALPDERDKPTSESGIVCAAPVASSLAESSAGTQQRARWFGCFGWLPFSLFPRIARSSAPSRGPPKATVRRGPLLSSFSPPPTKTGASRTTTTTDLSRAFDNADADHDGSSPSILSIVVRDRCETGLGWKGPGAAAIFKSRFLPRRAGSART